VTPRDVTTRGVTTREEAFAVTPRDATMREEALQ